MSELVWQKAISGQWHVARACGLNVGLAHPDGRWCLVSRRDNSPYGTASSFPAARRVIETAWASRGEHDARRAGA